MARPERNNVDYFPFLCKEGKTMYYIEQKYGNDGYATWVKILRQLAVTNYHYINLSDRVEMMYLASKCRVSEEVLCTMIDDLCDLGEFNKMLWKENQIIYNEKLVDSVKDAYLKRNNKSLTLESFLQLLESLGIRKLVKGEKKGTDNPHRREEKSIEEKKREDLVARKKAFSDTLSPYLKTYGKEMLNDFYLYWTEPNKSNTKVRWELEKTWSLPRRLSTWAGNDKNFKKGSGEAGSQTGIYTEAPKPINHAERE